MAHRVPTANGTQAGAADTARMLLQSSVASTSLARARHIRYAVLGRSMIIDEPRDRPVVPTIFDALAQWAGVPVTTYFDRYDSASGPVYLFHPEYFRTLAVHLAAFGGRQVMPAESWVATIVPGRTMQRVEDLRSFRSYAEAAAYAAGAPARRVVSIDPFSSCVPLDAIPWRRVYASAGAAPQVQIFEAAQ